MQTSVSRQQAKRKVLVLLLLCCAVAATGSTPNRDHVTPPKRAPLPGVKINKNTRVEDMEFWFGEAQDELVMSLARTENNNAAKNVILFLGDGMSMETITAARIYKGQAAGQSGEEYRLSWEDFPNLGLLKTYPVDKQVADSSSSASAYLSGAKTNYYTMGVDATASLDDCSSVTDHNKLTSVAAWALQAGKRAGFVTSTRVTHATPANLYAHSASRNWECDADIDEDNLAACPDMKDISRQLVEDHPGRDLNVIMGGGIQYMSANATDRPGDPVLHGEWSNVRQDGRDLVQEWQDDQAASNRSYAAVDSLSELQTLELDNIDYLMGLFANDHLPFEHQKRALGLDLPTLEDMTKAAITVLDNGEPEGFFLLVEGGKIDLAHHDNYYNTALDETAAMDDAVRAALLLVDTQETLVLVTADHSHVTAFNGYPLRGQDVTGIADLADDGLPYTTLTYANGPGYDGSYQVSPDGAEAVRRDITDDDVSGFLYRKNAAIPKGSDTHGGEDVPIYAIGPMSHLFQRTHEQSYVAHVMAYAACIGPYSTRR